MRKVSLGILLLAGILLAWLIAERSALLPPCVVRKYVGVHCPGCGVTRAAHALLHGDLWVAFRMNAVAVVLLPLLAYAMLREAVAWGWRRPDLRLGSGGRWGIRLGVLVVVFGVVRNLPGFGFLLPMGG